MSRFKVGSILGIMKKSELVGAENRSASLFMYTQFPASLSRSYRAKITSYLSAKSEAHSMNCWEERAYLGFRLWYLIRSLFPSLEVFASLICIHKEIALSYMQTKSEVHLANGGEERAKNEGNSVKKSSALIQIIIDRFASETTW